MIELTVHLRSYIAHPYWPEMERVINITKESGMSRARSSANRRKALEEHLKSTGMTICPNPGSREALDAGCICAVLDNNHGTQAPFPPDGWYLTEGCPIHTGRADD